MPIHTLRNTQISRLQKGQNRALRFATGRDPYTLSTQEIHALTNTLPVNIRLHLRARKNMAETRRHATPPIYDPARKLTKCCKM